MFKRVLFTILVGTFLCTGWAFAQDTDPVVEETVTTEAVDAKVLDLSKSIPTIGDIDITPKLKQGIIYSIDDQELSYAFTTEVFQYKGFALEGGYSVKDTIIAVASYRLGGLERFGINVPVLDLLDANVGYYVGWKDMNNSHESKFDHGVSATILNIKF